MIDAQKIERLATEVMGWYEEHSHAVGGVWNWEKCGNPMYVSRVDNKVATTKTIMNIREDEVWNPLAGWNHWRMVEEKVMQDDYLFYRMMEILDAKYGDMAYVKAPLSERVDAVIAALDSLSSSDR